MLTSSYVPKRVLTALSGFGFLIAGTGAGVAEQLCFPHCDYVHYYGPYDFSYKQPGLFGYPQCGPQGDCAPNLVYMMAVPRPGPTGRITVRPRPLTPRQ